MTDQKKEKVLHTRIPESLNEEIREHASQLGVSVSNLVRNILNNAFGLVGDIVADTSSIASAARSSRPGPHPAPPAVPVAPVPPMPSPPPPAPPGTAVPQILGWQEALLNLNAVCDRCNVILARGTRAAIALFDVPAPRAFRCLTCLREDLPSEHDDIDAHRPTPDPAVPVADHAVPVADPADASHETDASD